MLVIGDSIAEGDLILGYGTIQVNMPQYMSGRLSFGVLLGQLLGFDVWKQTFGGTGFYGPYEGSVPETDLNWNWTANAISPSPADPQFNFVLIETGYNDGSLDSTDFITRYTSLIAGLKAAYPAALIFCLQPIWGHTADVNTVASNTGSIYIPTISATPAWQYTTSTSSDPAVISMPNYNHPDAHGHSVIANYYLAPIFAQYFTQTLRTTNIVMQ
jgi:hypothetical protein